MLDIRVEPVFNETTMKLIKIVEIHNGSVVEAGKIINAEVCRVLAEAKVNEDFLKILPLLKDVYQSQISVAPRGEV